MPEYRYVGAVAGTAEIGDKLVPVAPGDFVEMSSEEYQQAAENGMQFIEAAAPKQEGAATKTEGKGGEK